MVMNDSQFLPGMPVEGIDCYGVSRSPEKPPPRRLLMIILGCNFNKGRILSALSLVISVGVSNHNTAIGPYFVKISLICGIAILSRYSSILPFCIGSH